MERKYRAELVIGDEKLDVHMSFSTEGATVEECDEQAKKELARDAHSILKGSKFWVLEREEWVVV